MQCCKWYQFVCKWYIYIKAVKRLTGRGHLYCTVWLIIPYATIKLFFKLLIVFWQHFDGFLSLNWPVKVKLKEDKFALVLIILWGPVGYFWRLKINLESTPTRHYKPRKENNSNNLTTHLCLYSLGVAWIL